MNKLVKGSIAGAAGIALLLGGAGTLAAWNDSASLASAGTISSGELKIAVTQTGAWDKSIAKIVPGDNLTFTEKLTVTAVGDNLSFDLGTNIETLVAASTFSSATVVSDFDVTKGGVAVSDLSGLEAGVYVIDVTVTVDFPSSTAGVVDQNKSLDLSTATVTVTQVP